MPAPAGGYPSLCYQGFGCYTGARAYWFPIKCTRRLHSPVEKMNNSLTIITQIPALTGIHCL